MATNFRLIKKFIEKKKKINPNLYTKSCRSSTLRINISEIQTPLGIPPEN